MKNIARMRAAGQTILMLLFSTWLGTSNALAQVILVDAFPGEPGCDIRDAISSANQDTSIGGCAAGSGDDFILFSGSHNIPAAFNDPGVEPIFGDAALPAITTNITIRGINGGAKLNRSAAATSRFRVINVRGGELRLENLTITGGFVSDNEAADDSINRGGGIFIESGSLILDNVKVVNNIALSNGGGIYSQAASAVEIKSSELDGNRANRGAAFQLANVSSPVLVEESTIESNITNSRTGSIADLFVSDGSFQRSSVINNLGTGIEVLSGSLSVLDSTISGNGATPADSPFFEDVSGITLSPGAGSSLVVLNSTIVNNPPQTGVIGSAILAHGIQVFAPDQTLGQGLAVSLRNNIISANGGAGSGRTEIGREVHIIDDFGNQDAGVIAFNVVNNVLGFNGVSTSAALNQVAINPADNIFATSNSANPLSLSAIINPLDDYGGPTLSHTLPQTSPAINAGTDGFFSFVLGTLFFIPGCRGETIFAGPVPDYRVDQRGLSRPVGALCDIGSTEFRRSDIIDSDSCYVVKAANGNTLAFCL